MFKKKKSKMKLSKQKLALIIISPLAILAIILVILDIYNRQQETEGEEVLEEEVVREEDERREEIIVPDSDTELTDEQREVIAVPEKAVSSNPSSGTMSQDRSFSFNLENDNLINVSGTGKEINVYQYDNITLYFTAIDKDYDINIPDFSGQYFEIMAGDTIRRSLQFSFTGSFPFYCEVCGGIDSQASGVINVFERE